jgi:hypothetical protein
MRPGTAAIVNGASERQEQWRRRGCQEDRRLVYQRKIQSGSWSKVVGLGRPIDIIAHGGWL